MAHASPKPDADPEATYPAGMVEGQLIYAIGDIHGCYDPLRDLLARISHDAEIHAAGRTACLIFCGDYIDRGPSSAQVLDALCWLKRYGPYHMHFLKGNHEAAMLDYIADPGSMREWLRFGGTETLLSYGLTPPGAEAPAPAHVAARDDLLERMPVAHLRFLEQLELMVGVGDYAFVHAGIRPGVPLAEQEEEDLLWIRKGFVDVDRPHERIIVHGHSISAEPEMLPHRIGIDTGAYKTGVLTALRLEDGSAAFLATR